MISSVTNSEALPVLERLVQFAGARHRLIVGNIANLDTPEYRPVDASVKGFQAALGRAIDRIVERPAFAPAAWGGLHTWGFSARMQNSPDLQSLSALHSAAACTSPREERTRPAESRNVTGASTFLNMVSKSFFSKHQGASARRWPDTGDDWRRG